jgi:hypothetical protein
MILKELPAPAEVEVALPEPNQCQRIGWMHPCQEILMQQICRYWIVVWVETEVEHQVLRVIQAKSKNRPEEGTCFFVKTN